MRRSRKVYMPRVRFVGATNLVAELLGEDEVFFDEAEAPRLSVETDGSLPPLLEPLRDVIASLDYGKPAEIIHYIIPGNFPRELGDWRHDRREFYMSASTVRELGRRAYLTYYAQHCWELEGIRDLGLSVTGFEELFTRSQGSFPAVLSTEQVGHAMISVITTDVLHPMLRAMSNQIAKGESIAIADPNGLVASPAFREHFRSGSWLAYSGDQVPLVDAENDLLPVRMVMDDDGEAAND